MSAGPHTKIFGLLGSTVGGYRCAGLSIYLWVFLFVCVSKRIQVCVCVCTCAQMAAPRRGVCVSVSCNSRGWMEDRLSGSQGRVDRLLKTVERDTTGSAHANSQNRHTALVSVIAGDRQPSQCLLTDDTPGKGLSPRSSHLCQLRGRDNSDQKVKILE